MITKDVLREFMMNACMHCDYQANTQPFHDYSAIMNAGGLYDEARPVNLPMGNDYCNSIVEEDMSDVKYINSSIKV